jgi:cytochrome c
MISPAEVGKIIFEGRKLYSLSQRRFKVNRPLVYRISPKYTKRKRKYNFILKSEAIVDPEQYEVMAANLALTKTFTDTELQAIEAIRIPL